MKRKLLVCILTGLLLVGLTACGAGKNSGGSGDSGNPGQTGGTGKQPSGLYTLAYYCDENGEYVEDLNVTEYYDGYPTTELEMLYEDKHTYWVDIKEDGTGTYYSPFDEVEELELKPEEGQIWYGDIFYDYKYDADKDAYWYGDSDLWYYMKSCTQDEVDRIYDGKGGSVPIEEAQVGDLVCIGNYDTNPYNEETESLYWRVIDKQDGKILVLCDKLIDSFAFNTNPDQIDLDKVTWENSSVREFLNNDFLNMMFTDEERARVLTTTNENKAANEELLEQWGDWEDRDGIPYSEQTYQVREDDADTEDKVFLLSYQEVLKYFGEPTEEYTGDGGYPFTEMEENPDWKALVTRAVDYNAIGYYDTDSRYGAWMTRTLSTALNEEGPLVTYITSEGEVFNFYTYSSMFIRPAMWISTEN